jgi:Protein of unknown function (DUF3822)
MLQSDFQYLENINEFRLSVVLMADSFFYAVFDTDNKLICHKSFTEIKYSSTSGINMIVNDENLRRSFSSIVVVAHTNLTYHVQQKDDNLLSLLPGLELKSKKVEKLPGNEIYSYFGISPHQEALLDGLFGDKSYILKSESAVLSTYYIGNFDEFIHVHLESSSLVLFVQKEGKMVFYNTFFTNGMDDILYFILATCTFANMNPESSKVNVSGWIESESVLFKHLCGYLGNIKILEDSQFTLSQSVSTDIKPHYYFLHYLNNLCAS